MKFKIFASLFIIAILLIVLFFKSGTSSTENSNSETNSTQIENTQ